jgi:hypothetical protein
VQYTYQNIHKPVSEEELAGMVYMGRNSFLQTFGDMMK